MKETMFCSAVLLGMLMSAGAAQSLASQEPPPAAPSLGEVARKLREQKKDQSSTEHVWTNDNIPTAPGSVNVVGQTAQPAVQPQKPAVAPSGAPLAGAEPSAATGPTAGQSLDELKKQLADAKESLGNARVSLDLMQRDYDLRLRQLSSDPYFSTNRRAQAELAAASRRIEDQKEIVHQQEAKVAELEDRVKALEGKPATETPQPPQS